MHGFLHYCGQIINRFFHKSIFEPGTVSLFFQRKLIIVEWPCFIHTNVVRNSKGLCKSPLLKTNIVLGELFLFGPHEYYKIINIYKSPQGVITQLRLDKRKTLLRSPNLT